MDLRQAVLDPAPGGDCQVRIIQQGRKSIVKFSLRIAGAVVGIALTATACGTTAPKLANQATQAPTQDNPAEQGHQANTRQANAKADAKAAQDAANAKAAQDAANAKAAAAKVTLGIPWAPNTTGYGTARPSEISSGGDASGSVTNITWDSWGGAQATGTGTASYGAGSYGTCTQWLATHPGKEDCNQRVPIVAYRLGNCNGHQGYNAVEWYFPQAGGTRDLSKPDYGLPSYDICSSDGVSAVIPAVPAPTTPTVGSGVQRDIATKPAPYAADTSDKGSPQAYALAFADSGAVNLHREPAVSSDAFSQLATGTYMTVHCSARGDTVVNDAGRSSDVWYYVSFSEGMDGFMSSVFIDFATGNTSWVVPVCPAGTGG
jgi:hypothetical protein